jgi:hypothetical protein
MIQAEEKGGLGDGQKIETEMAREAGIKVFRKRSAITSRHGMPTVAKTQS